MVVNKKKRVLFHSKVYAKVESKKKNKEKRVVVCSDHEGWKKARRKEGR